MSDWTPFLIVLLAFAAMASLAYVGGQYYLRAVHLYRRLPLPQSAEADSTAPTSSAISRFVVRHIDIERLGVDETLRGKLRQNLIRAGYFRRDAITYYVFWRFAAVVLLPMVAYLALAIFAPQIVYPTDLIIILIATGLGVIGPDALISRRQRLLGAGYQRVFPDFLDLLVVCIEAGLSLDAALARITPEIGKRNHYFGVNMAIMGAEMRAGRSFVDALGTLAERVMIQEARSLVAVLRQSVELGSDAGQALRVFGDEMRIKRLLRAEEMANKLSIKMLMPMGLFIFPVIMMVVLLPVGIRIYQAFGHK